MAKMVAAEHGVAETSIRSVDTGREVSYKRDKSGLIEVNNPGDIRTLQKAGYTIWLGAAPKGGWFCAPCGFKSYFKKCSRCGGEGVKDK